MRKRNVLNVFIGSPSDLQDERRASREVVERVNRHLARNLDLYIELRGWEDTLPGNSRPQELINQDIIDCDLFLGLVWKRWGTPTGTYSSGFEEEFRLAESLIEEKKISDVWLFFRDIDNALLEDPGEQVRLVLNFKEQVTNERRFLYKQFASTTAWSNLLYDLLADYITRGTSQAESGTAASQYEGTARPSIEDSVEERSELIAVTRQLAEALETDSLAEFDQRQRSRILLFASSLFEGPVIAPEPVGTHEIQALYREGPDFHLLPSEQHITARTLVADEHNICVGWRWLKTVSAATMLSLIARDDHETSVRVQALKLMRPIVTEVDTDVLNNAVHDNDENIQTTCLELMEEYGTESHIHIIESVSDDSPMKVQQMAWTAKLAVLSRCSPNDAIEFALDVTNTGRGALSGDFSKVVEAADERTISRLLESGHESLVLSAIRSASDRIDKKKLMELQGNEPEPIRLAATKALLDRFPNEVDFKSASESLAAAIDKSNSYIGLHQRKSHEQTLVRLYQTLSIEELQAGIQWFGLDGPQRYEALARKSTETIGDTLRQDILTGFERIRTATLERLTSSQPKQIMDVDGFIRNHYLDAAMRVLVSQALRDDVTIATHVLGQQSGDIGARDAVGAAFDILKAHGGPDNVEILLTLVARLKAHDPARRSAAQLALELDSSPDCRAAAELLKQGDEYVLPVVLRAMLWQPKIFDDNRVRALLYHEKDSVREAATCVLACKCNERQLESLLNEYSKSGRYYYNVTCWLDRWLYSPGGLRPGFRSRLKNKCGMQDLVPIE